MRNRVHVQILDELGKPTAAKIRITAQDSIYFAPVGYRSDFVVGEAGEDAMLDNNRRFAYADGVFDINLPVTNLRFEVVKVLLIVFMTVLSIFRLRQTL